MKLEDSLDLWLKYRNATEQRNYWFLLAQATAMGLVVGNLNNLIVTEDRCLAVFAVSGLGVGSAIITVASALAYRWDWDRLAAVSALIDPDHRAVFSSDWDQSALYGPFAFALFYFSIAARLAATAASWPVLIGVVAVAILAAFLISLALTKDFRAFLRDRRAAAARGAASNPRLERPGA